MQLDAIVARLPRPHRRRGVLIHDGVQLLQLQGAAGPAGTGRDTHRGSYRVGHRLRSGMGDLRLNAGPLGVHPLYQLPVAGNEAVIPKAQGLRLIALGNIHRAHLHGQQPRPAPGASLVEGNQALADLEVLAAVVGGHGRHADAIAQAHAADVYRLEERTEILHGQQILCYCPRARSAMRRPARRPKNVASATDMPLA